MGYVGTVCVPVPYLNYRSNLNEYLNDDMTAGHVRILKVESKEHSYNSQLWFQTTFANWANLLKSFAFFSLAANVFGTYMGNVSEFALK